MTVNIAKRFFVHYTNVECERWKIPTSKTTSLVFLYDENRWDEKHVMLPIHPDTGEGMLFTPKSVVRRFVDLDWKNFYQDFLREILKERMIHEGNWGALGKPKKITWKRVKEEYPFNKGTVVEIVHKEPILRHQYTKSISRNLRQRGQELTISNLGLENGVPVSFDALKKIVSSTKASDSSQIDVLKDFVNQKSREQTQTPPEDIFFLLTDELNSVLERTTGELVVVLGPYSDDKKPLFDSATGILTEQEYSTCVIKDMPDIGSKNPRQKVFTYASAARFILVIDSGPSGHLNEIELLKDLGVPVAILTFQNQGSSFMLAGIEDSSTFFRRFRADQDFGKAVLDAIEWAEDKLSAVLTANRLQCPWMKD